MRSMCALMYVGRHSCQHRSRWFYITLVQSRHSSWPKGNKQSWNMIDILTVHQCHYTPSLYLTLLFVLSSLTAIFSMGGRYVEALQVNPSARHIRSLSLKTEGTDIDPKQNIRVFQLEPSGASCYPFNNVTCSI